VPEIDSIIESVICIKTFGGFEKELLPLAPTIYRIHATLSRLVAFAVFFLKISPLVRTYIQR
jgi:hypothetical protein